MAIAGAAAVPEDRVDQTMRWLIGGMRDLDVLDSIATTWPDQDRTALMTAVMAKFRESAVLPPEYIKGWVYEARIEIFRELVDAGEWEAALRALRDIEGAK